MVVAIQRCQMDDLNTLCAIAAETYDETFRSMNTSETMDKYLQEAFSSEEISAELQHPGCAFYFLRDHGDLAGYLKTNEAPAQTDLNDPLSLEIERIYVRKVYQGKGLGRHLLDFAIQQAVETGKEYIWLGVWEKNGDAIAFYRKMGFDESGRHLFRMGDEWQADIIMKKMVSHICIASPYRNQLQK